MGSQAFKFAHPGVRGGDGGIAGWGGCGGVGGVGRRRWVWGRVVGGACMVLLVVVVVVMAQGYARGPGASRKLLPRAKTRV